MPSRFGVFVTLVVVIFLGSSLGIALAVSDSGVASGTQVARAENSTIQVTNSADVAASPDRAVVRPAVVATADTADAARSDVAENASEMRATMEEFGVDDEQIRTTYVDISTVSESPEDGAEIRGYRAAQGFEIEVDVGSQDLGNRTGAIVDAAVGNGANQIDGVSFTLSDDRRQELRRQALEDATNDARAEAEHLAAVGDLSITGVASISTRDGGVSPFDATVRETAADGAATSFDPEPVTVSAQVTVTYRAE